MGCWREVCTTWTWALANAQLQFSANIGAGEYRFAYPPTNPNHNCKNGSNPCVLRLE